MSSNISLPTPVSWAEAARSGDRRALARLLTAAENHLPGIEDAFTALYPHTGGARWIGITGAPGTGKSTLVTALAKAYRAQEKTVGILAVDPSSPFTGGAILGDRIRMRDLHGDDGVFIRSMAARGGVGGLANATRDAARVLDGVGFDIILIETVGAGQSEVAIARMAETTLVVEAPGMGDDVQAIKAGILEIADVLIVNKADRPGAAHTAAALRAMLDLGHHTRRGSGHHGGHHGHTMREAVTQLDDAPEAIWIPPILQTVAAEDKGINAVIEAIAAHGEHLRTTTAGIELGQARLERELIERIGDLLLSRALAQIPEDVLQNAIARMIAREIDPARAARELVDGV